VTMDKRLKPALAACLMTLCMVLGAPAQAIGLITGDPDAVENIARGYGSTQMETDNEGDPMITGRIKGIQYVIYFYGCNDQGKKCQELILTAGWSDVPVSLEKINEWNRTMKFGKAYLDADNDPTIEMAINLDGGGITAGNFDETFKWWSRTLGEFESEVIGK